MAPEPAGAPATIADTHYYVEYVTPAHPRPRPLRPSTSFTSISLATMTTWRNQRSACIAGRAPARPCRFLVAADPGPGAATRRITLGLAPASARGERPP